VRRSALGLCSVAGFEFSNVLNLCFMVSCWVIDLWC